MEVSIAANEINTQNIYFADKKKNIIVDGDFIKILYSTEAFEMNGLFIFVELFTARSKSDSECGDEEIRNRYIRREYSADSLLIHGGSKMERIFRPVSFADLSSASDDFSYMGGSDDSTERRNISDQNWIQITNNRNSNTAPHKRIILFNPVSLENIALINRLCEIEQSIIERYIKTYCPFKTASYILKNQLMNGTIKYHSENVHIRNRETRPQPQSAPFYPLNIQKCMFPAKQIMSVSGESAGFDSFIKNGRPKIERFILKISGVWETATNVGITMKFILVR